MASDIQSIILTTVLYVRAVFGTTRRTWQTVRGAVISTLHGVLRMWLDAGVGDLSVERRA